MSKQKIKQTNEEKDKGKEATTTTASSTSTMPNHGSSKAGEAAAESASASSPSPQSTPTISYVGYTNERQLPAIMALLDRDLSEPYSIFTYRYFLSGWPELCILAYEGEDARQHGEGTARLLGVIVGKADNEENNVPMLRGYIAMLAVETSYRRAGIGRGLVSRAVDRMAAMGCEEVVLETEVTNKGALGLYERLGFAREERLLKYYLNGVDAFRLKLWLLREEVLQPEEQQGKEDEKIANGEASTLDRAASSLAQIDLNKESSLVVNR